MEKTIIGITGHSGSGKGVVARYLEKKHSSEKINYSDTLRTIADTLFVEQSRAELDKLSKLLRSAYGEDVLGRVVHQKITTSQKQLFSLEGVRRIEDIEILKNIGKFILIFVDAPLETRYERVIARSENTGDTEKTLEEFVADQKNNAQLRIDDLREEADYVIENKGTLADMGGKIENMMQEL